MHCLFSFNAQKIVLYIILPKLLQVYDVWIWCLLKLLKCKMMALSLCCQGIVFVILVKKMWVNSFGAQSTVVEELVTLSRNGAAKKDWFLQRWWKKTRHSDNELGCDVQVYKCTSVQVKRGGKIEKVKNTTTVAKFGQTCFMMEGSGISRNASNKW